MSAYGHQRPSDLPYFVIKVRANTRPDRKTHPIESHIDRRPCDKRDIVFAPVGVALNRVDGLWMKLIPDMTNR
jgi:hypothetical protein